MTGETAVKQLAEALAELDEPKVLQLVDQILSESPETAAEAIIAIQSGMSQVGERFQSGEYFLAEMMFAAEVIKGVIPRLKDALKAGTQTSIGKVMLGTVRGDIHDIGKNLVAVMMTAAGFEVVDLGIDIRPNSFVAAIKEHQPNIVGLSGLLTLSIDPMKETVEAINAAGLRDRVKIIIGGNPITAQIHEMVGADAWTNNAAEGIEICKKWVEV